MRYIEYWNLVATMEWTVFITNCGSPKQSSGV